MGKCSKALYSETAKLMKVYYCLLDDSIYNAFVWHHRNPFNIETYQENVLKGLIPETVDPYLQYSFGGSLRIALNGSAKF